MSTHTAHANPPTTARGRGAPRGGGRGGMRGGPPGGRGGFGARGKLYRHNMVASGIAPAPAPDPRFPPRSPITKFSFLSNQVVAVPLVVVVAAVVVVPLEVCCLLQRSWSPKLSPSPT